MTAIIGGGMFVVGCALIALSIITPSRLGLILAVAGGLVLVLKVLGAVG